MPDLEMLLREVRPAPAPAFTARLDARVAARFPGPPPRWKAMLAGLRAHFMAFGAVGALGAAIVALVIAAPSFNTGSDDSANYSTGGGAAAPAATPAAGSDSSSSGSSGASSGAEKDAAPVPRSKVPAPTALSAPTTAPGPSAPRDVIASASLTLSTTPDQVAAVTDRVIRVIDGLGGFVQSSETSQSGNSASATMVVKIPSGKLDAGLAQLSKLANVKARTQQTQDVTDQKAALEASVRDARADRNGLRARLAKATTDKDRAHLRALLDRASRRVTRAERRVASIGQEVSYATVQLDVEGDRKPGAVPVKPGGKWGPGDALKDAGRVLEVIAGVALIALAILVPVAILVALGAAASRVITRRRRERALEMA
jgi:hypothetical protein